MFFVVVVVAVVVVVVVFAFVVIFVVVMVVFVFVVIFVVATKFIYKRIKQTEDRLLNNQINQPTVISRELRLDSMVV